MKTPKADHCVAIFDQHQDAERAIRALQRAGFDMKKLSIVGRDYLTDEHAVGFYNTGDRVRYWGKFGACWGAIFGVIFSPAFFWIPGIGPILTGGIISSMLMGIIEGGVVGAAMVGGTSALAAALVGLGIPKDSVIEYETQLKANKFLLIASGAPEEVERARGLLAEHNGQPELHAG
jgi:hypothetical protein